MHRFRSARFVIAGLLVSGGLPHLAHAAAACSFGPSGDGGASLQGVFNEMFGDSAAPSTTADCLADPNDALWHTDHSVGSATILVELAGNAGDNALGIYDSTSTLNSLEVFSGPAGAASRAFITVSGRAGAYRVQIDRFTGETFVGSVSSTFASSAFGFYLQQPAVAGGERFYSESFRNPGRNGSSSDTDYMYSYLGNGASFRTDSIFAPDIVEGTAFDGSDAIIAWESERNPSDGDFQDMVVLLRDIVPAATPVPVPAAVWLFGSAILGFGARLRRRK